MKVKKIVANVFVSVVLIGLIALAAIIVNGFIWWLNEGVSV